ncbi:hypothetical protein Tco_1502017 [Tanacetum coccineum]
MLSVGSSMLNGCGPRTCQWQSVAADIKRSRDMVVDENVSQAIIEHDDAIQHAQEISTKKTPQADGRKNAHQVTHYRPSCRFSFIHSCAGYQKAHSRYLIKNILYSLLTITDPLPPT